MASDEGSSRTSSALDATNTSRPGSLTLMESLEKKRRETNQRKGSSTSGGTDMPTSGVHRPLPKALQPKETRRPGTNTQPFAAPPVSSYTRATTRHPSPATTVSNSTLAENRRPSSVSGYPTTTRKPTVVSDRTETNVRSLSTSGSKPEVGDVTKETKDSVQWSSVGRSGVVQETNPGLLMLRKHQQEKTVDENSELARSPILRRAGGVKPDAKDTQRSSFADSFAFFSSSSDRLTPRTPVRPTFTPTPSKYSKFNTFSFDVAENKTSSVHDSVPEPETIQTSSAKETPLKPVKADETQVSEVSTVTIPDASDSPQADISTPLVTITSDGTLPVKDSSHSLRFKEDTTGSTEKPDWYDPIPVSPRSVIRSPKVPTSHEADGVASATDAPVTDKSSDSQVLDSPEEDLPGALDDSNNVDDDKPNATCTPQLSPVATGNDDFFESTAKHDQPEAASGSHEMCSTPVTNQVAGVESPDSPPPPLPASLPPVLGDSTMDDAIPDRSEDGESQWSDTSSALTGLYGRHFHRATDSNITVDSGLGRSEMDCFSGHDSSADELEESRSASDPKEALKSLRVQSPREHLLVESRSSENGSPQNAVVDRGGGPLSPTSSDVATTDSEVDDSKADQRCLTSDRQEEGCLTEVPPVLCSLPGSKATGVLHQLLGEHGTTLEELISQNEEPVVPIAKTTAAHADAKGGCADEATLVDEGPVNEVLEVATAEEEKNGQTLDDKDSSSSPSETVGLESLVATDIRTSDTTEQSERNGTGPRWMNEVAAASQDDCSGSGSCANDVSTNKYRVETNIQLITAPASTSENTDTKVVEYTSPPPDGTGVAGDVIQLVTKVDASNEEEVSTSSDKPGWTGGGIRDIEIVKGALGLGFCIEGGVGSAAGDRPLAVKRLFRVDTALGDLRAGDEILSVNGENFTQLSHYLAWNRLKNLPDGPFTMTVRRK